MCRDELMHDDCGHTYFWFSHSAGLLAAAGSQKLSSPSMTNKSCKLFIQKEIINLEKWRFSYGHIAILKAELNKTTKLTPSYQSKLDPLDVYAAAYDFEPEISLY
jgi:hypothetical protein